MPTIIYQNQPLMDKPNFTVDSFYYVSHRVSMARCELCKVEMLEEDISPHKCNLKPTVDGSKELEEKKINSIG